MLFLKGILAALIFVSTYVSSSLSSKTNGPPIIFSDTQNDILLDNSNDVVWKLRSEDGVYDGIRAMVG